MPKLSQEEKLIRRWWVRLLLAVAFLVIAYGFISLAIDKGSVFQYAVGIFFVGWAVVQLNRARKALFS